MRIRTFIRLLGILVGIVPCVVWGWQPSRGRCPYLDGAARPFYALELGLTSNSRTGDRGPRYAQVELRSEAALGYFHDVLAGDLDLGVRFDHVFPLRKSAFDAPRNLMVLAVEGRWFWRYDDTMAVELQLEPGVYASTEDLLDMPLGMPATLSGIYTLDPTLALVVGLQVRPSFHYVFVPHGGIVWEPHPQLRVDATLPEARATFHLDREWSGYAGWSWESTTYHVKPDADGRNRLTLTYQEIYMGISHALVEELRISGSLGWQLERDVRAARSHARDRQRLSMDDAFVLRVGLSGAF